MWRIKNKTPFPADGRFLRDKEGSEYWVVAVKAAFIADSAGRLSAADRQPDILTSPVYAGDATDELLAEADFAPFRPKPDILVVGDACAENGKPVEMQEIGMRVGDLQKSAVVVGPRRIRRRRKNWALLSAETWTRRPLSWRHSLGGQDVFARAHPSVHSYNPIGVGWSENLSDAADGADLDLPSIENPRELYHPDNKMPEPIGFGSIKPSWRPRLDFAGTYDQKWLAERSPLLPANFSEEFHQAAPRDQIYPGELRGGEPVELRGLHPEGNYGFALPKVALRATTRMNGINKETRFRIVSVCLDGSERRLEIVWNTFVPCNGMDHKVERTLLSVKKVIGARSEG